MTELYACMNIDPLPPCAVHRRHTNLIPIPDNRTRATNCRIFSRNYISFKICHHNQIAIEEECGLEVEIEILWSMLTWWEIITEAASTISKSGKFHLQFQRWPSSIKLLLHLAHISLTAHVKNSLEFMLGNIADNKRLFELARRELMKI